MAGKLAVFNLPDDCKDDEVNDLFEKYGRMTRACVRQTKSGDAMAFVEFGDPRDAEEAKRDKHGFNYEGRRLRVEFSAPPGGKGKGKGRRDSRGRGGGRGRDDSRRRNDSRGRGRGRGGPPPRKGGGKGPNRDSYFKVRIVGIPASASWQDVKDFLRKAGGVKFADLDPEERGCAIGGFDDRQEMERALKELDGEIFKARDGTTEKVTLEAIGGPKRGGGSRSRSRSPPPARKTRDESRSRSRSRSR